MQWAFEADQLQESLVDFDDILVNVFRNTFQHKEFMGLKEDADREEESETSSTSKVILT